MEFFESYRKFSAKYMNKMVEPYLGHFNSIHHDIRMSNFNIMLREYVSMSAMSGVLAYIISLPIVLIFSLLLFKSLLPIVALVLLVPIGIAVGTFMTVLKYPAAQANGRKRSIDNNLPFATLYMNTIAGTGAPPYLMFKLLAEFKEYGEVSTEAASIVQSIDVMGQDIEVAMQRVAEDTPSDDLKDLLWSLITTIVRGGDLKSLLGTKADSLMAAYRRKLDEYTNTLTMYVEVYITLVIVGAIFGMVMASIMGAISGFEGLRSMQILLVYVYLPMASILFIALLKLTSPVG